jgi:DNA repair ATPase RecN
LGEFRLEVQNALNDIKLAIQAADFARKEMASELRLGILSEVKSQYRDVEMCHQLHTSINAKIDSLDEKVSSVGEAVQSLTDYTRNLKHDFDSQLFGLRSHHLASVRELGRVPEQEKRSGHGGTVSGGGE